MCRDGFIVPCDAQGCTNLVTCRDWPRVCSEHYDEDGWPNYDQSRDRSETMGRVIEVDESGDFTALVWLPPNEEEVLADFKAKYLLHAQAGDLIYIHEDRVVRVDVGVWTKKQLDRIKRVARQEALELAKFTD